MSTQPISSIDSWAHLITELGILLGIVLAIIKLFKNSSQQNTQHAETVQKIDTNTQVTSAAAVISAQNNQLLKGTGDGGIAQMAQQADVAKAVEVIRGTGTGTGT
jgi:hypothetical protein